MKIEHLSVGIFYGAFSYLIGGVDKLFYCLCIFLVLDYITGISASFSEGKISSRRGWFGVFKKILTFTFIIVAAQLDAVAGNTEGFLRDAVILILIGSEGISITENLGRLGFKIPKPLRLSLEKLKDTENKGEKKEGE